MNCKNLSKTGWPEDKSQVPNSAVSYYNVRDELTVQNGVIFRGERMVTPKSLRRDLLQPIHASTLVLTVVSGTPESVCTGQE